MDSKREIVGAYSTRIKFSDIVNECIEYLSKFPEIETLMVCGDRRGWRLNGKLYITIWIDHQYSRNEKIKLSRGLKKIFRKRGHEIRYYYWSSTSTVLLASISSISKMEVKSS